MNTDTIKFADIEDGEIVWVKGIKQGKDIIMDDGKFEFVLQKHLEEENISFEYV